MDYKKIYYETLKKLCLKDSNEFDYIVEQERPEFANKLIINEDAEPSSLYKFKLNEELATEQDYYSFCEYIYNYVGIDFNKVINKNSFANFGKTK